MIGCNQLRLFQHPRIGLDWIGLDWIGLDCASQGFVKVKVEELKLMIAMQLPTIIKTNKIASIFPLLLPSSLIFLSAHFQSDFIVWICSFIKFSIFICIASTT